MLGDFVKYFFLKSFLKDINLSGNHTSRYLKFLIASVIAFVLATSQASFAGPVLPIGGSFAAGGGTIVSSGPSMTINQNTPKGIINWQGFSIGQGGSVLFNNGQGATLNRVTGSSLSSIAGLLKATGSVYLINPNGIVITSTGSVITGGDFIASALNISDSNFLNGNLSFSGTTGSVTNNGSIVSSGNAVLVGTMVTNNGTVSSSGTASLVSGTRLVLIPENGPSGILISPSSLPGNVTNSGIIKAASVYLSSSSGDVYALAGNNGGLIEATGTKTINGQVWLTAPKGTVSVNAPITASGLSGTILIDGLNNYINSNSILNASGSGGVIKIGLFPSLPESLSTTLSSGATILAGGINGKGFIDTSGDNLSIGNITVNANGGEWLLDPEDLTIDSAAATTIDNTLGSSGSGTNVTLETTSAGTSSTVGTTTTSPSAIGTSGSSTDPGNINVNAPISWGSTAFLTLSAYNSINVNSTITASGGGGIVLDYNTVGAASNYLTDTGVLKISMNMGSIQFTGTTGSPATPTGTLTTQDSTDTPVNYTLVNANNLQTAINVSLSGDYALATNITAPSSLTPIGESTAFTGIFNGMGNTINELIIGTSGSPYTGAYAGLFGQIGSGGIVENVGLTNESIYDNNVSGYNGGIVGYNSGTILNFYSTGNITGATSNTDNGGIAGVNNNVGIIENSYSTDAVSGGGAWNGGIAGYNYGTILNSYFMGTVSGGGAYNGGIAGRNNAGTISDSYSMGTVSGSGSYNGGIAGFNNGTIKYSYSTDAVSGGMYNGGIAGENYSGGPISDSYWDTTYTASGVGLQSGTGSGTGLTDSQMKQSSNFTGWGSILTSYNPPFSVTTPTTAFAQYNGYTYPLITGLYTQISTTGQLNSVTDSGYYVLINDINATGFTLASPISESTPFTGDFNGLGNAISNLTINGSTNTYVGLFGQVASTATVENLGLIGESVSGGSGAYNGGIAGNNDGTISDSYSTVSVSGGSLSYNGGIAGYNYGVIENSHSTGTVTGGANADGGIAGYNNGGTIENSYSTASVSGGFEYNGGIAGYNHGLVENSYSTGAVSGAIDNGGIAGENYGTISDSYSTGSVSGGGATFNGGITGLNNDIIEYSYSTAAVSGGSGAFNGGIAGVNQAGISDSYWDTTYTASGVGLQSGTGSGTGLTDSQMKQSSNFTGWGSILTSYNPPFSVTTPTTAFAQYNGYTYPLITGLYTQISTTGQLNSVTDSGYYVLINDINATGFTLASPISESTPFTGDFNGLGNTISGLTISSSDSYVGLFGQVGSGGTVENLGLTGESVTGGTGLIGGIVGYNDDGTIENSYSTGSVNSGNAYIGGIAGQNNGMVEYSYSTDAVSGGWSSNGGIVGYNDGDIEYSYSTGNVSGSTGNNGGIAGYNDTGGTVEYSYSTGAVSGGAYNGGIAGYNDTGGTVEYSYSTGAVSDSLSYNGGIVGYNGGTISNSYSTGRIFSSAGSSAYNGGIAGYNDTGGTVEYSYSTGAVSGSTSGGIAGENGGVIIDSYWDATYNAGGVGLQDGTGFGTGLTDSQMKLTSYFTGFDITTDPSSASSYTWFQYNGNTYPLLTAFMTPVTVLGSLVIYDGNTYTSASSSELTYSINPVNTSDIFGTITYTGGGTNAGTYPITITNKGLYSNQLGYIIKYGTSQSLTINPETLTYNAVTDTKTYNGTATSSGTPTLSGTVYNGDTITGIIQSFNSPNALGANGSTLAVNTSGASFTSGGNGSIAGDYNITAGTTATGTINPAALTVTANNDTLTYNAAAFTGGNGITASGLQGSDTVSSLGTPSYGGTSQGAVNAGTYAIIPSGLTDGNYTYTYANGALTINPETLTYNAVTDTKTYNGTATSSGTPTLSGTVYNGDTITGIIQSFNSPNALGANGSTLAVNTSGASFTSGGNGSIAGDYNVVAGNTASGTINPETLTYNAVTDTKTYNGTATSSGTPTLSGTVYNGDTITGIIQSFNSPNALGANGSTLAVNTSGASFTSGGNGSIAGDYNVVAGNTASGTINPETLTYNAVTDTKTYNGTATSSGTPTLSGTVYNGDTITGIIQSFNSPNALGANGSTLAVNTSGASFASGGNGSIAGDYNITAGTTATGTINPAALTVTANNDTLTYNAAAFTGGNGITASGLQGSDTVSSLGTPSYGGTSQGAVNAGTYAIIPSGLTDGNYTYTYANGALTINPETLTYNAVTDTKTYNGTATSSGTPTLSGTVYNGDTITGIIQSFNSPNALGANGSTLTVNTSGNTFTSGGNGSIAGDYNVVAGNTASGTINPETLTYSAVTNTKTYNGTATSSGTPTLSGTVYNGDTITGIIQSFNSPNALGANGSTLAVNTSGASFTSGGNGSIAGDYNITAGTTATGTINPETLTYNAVTDTKTYNGTATSSGTPTLSGTVYNGDTITGIIQSFNSPNALGANGSTLAVNTSGASFTSGGNGSIAGDYNITAGTTATGTINPAALTVTTDSASFTYSGSAYSGTPGYTVTSGILYNSDILTGGTYSYNGSSVPTNAGSYGITLSSLSNSNYNISYAATGNGTLNIASAQLIVTANNYSYTYNGTPYSGGNGVTYSGFVGGQNSSVLSGTLTYSGTSQGAVNAGTYVIIPGGLADTNYAITIVNGTLTIKSLYSSVFQTLWANIPVGIGVSSDNSFNELEAMLTGYEGSGVNPNVPNGWTGWHIYLRGFNNYDIFGILYDHAPKRGHNQ